MYTFKMHQFQLHNFKIKNVQIYNSIKCYKRWGLPSGKSFFYEEFLSEFHPNHSTRAINIYFFFVFVIFVEHGLMWFSVLN